MPKKKTADARMTDIKAQFLSHAEELWDTHEEEFSAVLKDSESNKIGLTFTATLDFSESTAKLQTVMRFSQVVTDRKEADFDDPNQPALPLEEAAEEAEEKPKRGRPKKQKEEAV